jgi:hypothetical protein
MRRARGTDDRIDQRRHAVGTRQRIRLGPMRWHVEDHHTQWDVDLRCRQPRAVDVAQGLDHVGDQAADLGSGRVGDLVGAAAEDRVPHAGDLENGHTRQYGSRPRPGKALAKNLLSALGPAVNA